MKINIIHHDFSSNVLIDVEVLSFILKKFKEKPQPVYVNVNNYKCEEAIINIFIESINYSYFSKAKYNIFIPNQQYFHKNQIEFLLYTIKIIRDCLLFNFSDRNLLKTNQQETEFISKLTSFVHENNIPIIIEKLEKSVNLINRNANAKILFFELSLQMSKLLKVEHKSKIR